MFIKVGFFRKKFYRVLLLFSFNLFLHYFPFGWGLTLLAITWNKLKLQPDVLFFLSLLHLLLSLSILAEWDICYEQHHFQQKKKRRKLNKNEKGMALMRMQICLKQLLMCVLIYFKSYPYSMRTKLAKNYRMEFNYVLRPTLNIYIPSKQRDRARMKCDSVPMQF